MKKRNKDLRKLAVVIDVLSHSNPLDPKYRNHALTGNYIKEIENAILNQIGF